MQVLGSNYERALRQAVPSVPVTTFDFNAACAKRQFERVGRLVAELKHVADSNHYLIVSDGQVLLALRRR